MPDPKEWVLGPSFGGNSGGNSTTNSRAKWRRFPRLSDITTLFEGRCSIQLSYGRTDDRSDSKPLLDFVSTYLELDHARASSSG